ncbi:MAG TPA: PHB depolymerase family esterase [Candidatus Limnocylindrales bacterium]
MTIGKPPVDKPEPRESRGRAARLTELTRGGRPSPRVAALAGIGGALLWAAVLAVEVMRAHLSHSLVSRPDRVLGWGGAPFAVPLMLMTALAGVLLVILALGLRAAIRSRSVWGGFVVLLGVAAAANVAIQLFPTDAAMYETSPLRGAAGIVFDFVLPVAAVLAGVGLVRSGSTVAGWGSVAAGIVMAWAEIDATAMGAMAGAGQPQSEGAIAAEMVGMVWIGGLSLVLLALRGEDHVSAVRSRRARLAFGGLGAGLAVLVAIQMVVTLVGYGVMGPAVTAQLQGRTQVSTVSVDSVARSYRVYRPASVASRPGLVIVLSGVYGSGFQAEVTTGFDAQADRLGWLAAYPDSVLDGWDAFGSTSDWGRHPGADDVAFIGAVIDKIVSGDGVDPGRVYVTGMSRGGMMTHRIGCELASKVAAVAPVSGNMATATGSAADVPCNPARPVSVLAIHGTADGAIPIAGGRVDIPFSPLVDVMARWRIADGCGDTSSVATDGSSTTTSWQCPDGATVAMRVVQGGWHVWPGTPTGAGGPDAFDGSGVIADFFVAHARASG